MKVVVLLVCDEEPAHGLEQHSLRRQCGGCSEGGCSEGGCGVVIEPDD
jgi:hypothetical protein